MKFITEAQRLNHKEASLISIALWNREFANQLPDECLTVMRLSTNELMVYIDNVDPSDGRSEQDKIRLFISAMASHSDLTYEQLLLISLKLNIDSEQQD